MIYLHLLVLALLVMQSCTYEPKGEDFVTIDPSGKPANIQIDLNAATDTIWVQKDDYLTFAYTLNGDKVNWAKFILNGVESRMIEEKSSSVFFSSYLNNITSGTYTLEMQLFTSSQTGSIADKVGAEGFLLSKKWTIVVKDHNAMGSKITKTAFVDGSLRVDWEMFKGLNFKYYKVYKYLDYVSNNLILLATINAQDQTYFIDYAYHGERSNYYVITNDVAWGPSTLVTGPLPALTASNATNGDIVLKWTKPPYYKNLKGYRISYRDQSGTMQVLGTTANADTESFIVQNPAFAYKYDFYLSPLALTNLYYEDWMLPQFLSTRATGSYGVTSPGYRMAFSGMAPISYLLNDTLGILAFDHRTFSTTQKFKYADQILQFQVSANNHYLVSSSYSAKKINLEDLVNPANSKRIDLSATFPQLGSISSVSDAGTGVVFNLQTAILYDYLNERKLAEINLGNLGMYSTKISSSGNFFYTETYNGFEFFEYKDGQIVRLPGNFTSSDGLFYVQYLPGTNEKLVRAFKNRIEVLDCSTWTIEKTWQYPNQITEVYNLDMKSGKLFMREANSLILFDITTGVKDVVTLTIASTYVNHWELFFNNGQILWGEGKAFL